MLPLDVDEVADYLAVHCTEPDATVMCGMQQYAVRQWKVRAALEWLRRHNRAYENIKISEENLAKLPAAIPGEAGVVPVAFIQAAVPGRDEDLRCAGPAEVITASS